MFLFLAHQHVLCPTTSFHYLKYSNVFKELVSCVKDMNWCKLVLDEFCKVAKSLQQNMDDFENGEKKTLWLKGCTLLLEISLYEYIFYVERIDCGVITTPWYERATPCVLDWTDKKIIEVYAKTMDFDNTSVQIFHYRREVSPEKAYMFDRAVNSSHPINADAMMKDLMLQVAAMKSVVISVVNRDEEATEQAKDACQRAQNSERHLLALQDEVRDLRQKFVKLETEKLKQAAEMNCATIAPVVDKVGSSLLSQPILDKEVAAVLHSVLHGIGNNENVVDELATELLRKVGEEKELTFKSNHEVEKSVQREEVQQDVEDSSNSLAIADKL